MNKGGGSMAVALLAVVGLLAATTPGSASLVNGQDTSRGLLQTNGQVPSNLVPTQEAAVSSEGSCDAGSDVSSFYLEALSSSVAVVNGLAQTTFYMRLMRDRVYECVGGCCEMAVSKIWVDVDPNIKVTFSSFAGSTTSFVAAQDEYGYHMTHNDGGAANLELPESGLLLSITVEGSNTVDLCQSPDYFIGSSVRGMCQVILSGATPAQQCCPMSVARLLAADVALPPDIVPPTPACSTSMDNSPFELGLWSAQPFTLSGKTYTNYTFVVSDTAGCDARQVNSCCGMSLDAVQLSIVASVNVISATVPGYPSAMVSFSASTEEGHKVMTVRPLGISDVPAAGTAVVVMVEGTADLCRPGTSDGTVGICSYVLAATSMCCPTSATGSVQTGAEVGCEPDVQAPIEDTTMGFHYYDKESFTDRTVFQFKVTNYEGCGSSNCLVCSWQLAVDPALIALGAVSFEGTDNGNVAVTAGGVATFTSVPGASATRMYIVTVNQPSFMLGSLCTPDAMPGQSKACAVVLRSASVYSTVSFDESDRVGAPAPPPVPPACENQLPLADACLRVDAASWASNEHGTTMEFRVQNHEGLVPGCLDDDEIMSFELLLQAPVVNALQASSSFSPSYVEWPNEGNAIVWQFTPVANGSPIHYQVWVYNETFTPEQMCLQNALPDQPKGSCVVVFSGSTQCFSGFVPVTYDNSLPGPTPIEDKSKSSANVAVIVPVVLVVVFVVCGIIAAVIMYRKRKASRAGQYREGSDGGLSAPLGARSVSDAGSVSHSDVNVGLFGSSNRAGPSS